MQFLRTPSRRYTALTLTPLIDVVFILLLFFMLATNYQRWHTVAIDAKPIMGAIDSRSNQSATIQLSSTRIIWEQETVSIARLVALLKIRIANNPDLVIAVEATADVPLQQLVNLIDRVKSIGVAQINLVDSGPVNQ